MAGAKPQYITEKKHVEESFLEQLKGLGWEVFTLDMHQQKPVESWRDSFDDVILLPKLREALIKINDWLDDDQIDEAVNKILNLPGTDLLANNQHVLNLILEGTTSDRNRKTQEISPTINYIDFKSPESNCFVAICQFKVRIPGTDRHFVPDITLFLNGLPIATVECKSPKVREEIAEAIDQMLRYSEQRGESGEGNKRLFYYNQFLIATSRQVSKVSTITAQNEKHFNNWSDPYPLTLNDLKHGESAPNQQQRLVAGMFTKASLLSLIKTFTVFTTTDQGQTIKVIARYQQFRAVKKSVKRLLNGKTKHERGGIIWHTQGSGKSLTMMFLVREMYTYPELTKWKIIYITDRTQLENQLSGTTQKVGLNVKVASSIKALKALLTNTSSDLVMGMIHKFQERDLEISFPELNTSDHILVMTDEAHRTQYKLLGANLDKALPNATYIGFTGTPTDKTERRFGDYIDKYTMREAIDDEVTVEIVYEGRTHNAEVADKPKMDKEFADVFSDYNLAERLQILGFGTRDAYLDAEKTIEAKAKDMVEHYISHVFPNGFKAQVVGNSREAAVRYRTAIEKALTREIEKLEKDPTINGELKLTPTQLDTLRSLKAAVVISGGSHNDGPHLKANSDPNQHKRDIASFRLPYGREKDGINGDIGFIIVNNMLLTGFDAPLEQVLYLDQVMKAHNLLQAIARVNRVYDENKTCGFVVDYVGVGHHLKDALADYDEREQKEIVNTLENSSELIGEVISAHGKLKEFLKSLGIVDQYDYDAYFDYFYDEEIRFEFLTLFKAFSQALDKLYPSKAALDFLPDFKQYSEINVMASKHFIDSRLSMKGIPEKLRKIADHHLISKGIDQSVEPIPIFDKAFQEQVAKRTREKTKAAEIEHAIRHHLDVSFDIDPELYASFAEALEEILREFKDNWRLVREKLEELRRQIGRAEKAENTYGLNRRTQMPFFRIFRRELFGERELSDEEISLLVSLTKDITAMLSLELQFKGFWENIPARNRLRASLQQLILSQSFVKLPDVVKKRGVIISRILETAEKNNDALVAAA